MALKVKNVEDTVVTLNYAECIQDGGKYALICEKHSYILQDSNKNRLWQHASNVQDWCAACAGQDERF